MKKFFLGISSYHFYNFNFAHILYIVILLILIILILKYKNKIRSIQCKTFFTISIISSIIIILNQLIYRGAYALYGKFNWQYQLDLYFCFIVDYLFVISILKKDNSLYKLVYPMVFMGPLIAIILPCWTYGPDTYVFYQTIISHGFLFVMNLFVFCYRNEQLKFIDFFRSLILANGIIIMTYIFNNIYGTSYNEPADVFNGMIKGKFFWDLINGNGGYILLEVVAILGCFISSIFNKLFGLKKTIYEILVIFKMFNCSNYIVHYYNYFIVIIITFYVVKKYKNCIIKIGVSYEEKFRLHR